MSLGKVHPNSPTIGTIVECTDSKRHLTDPKGYKVEDIGWSRGFGVPYGCFTARGVAHGGLYQFNVSEYRVKQSACILFINP